MRVAAALLASVCTCLASTAAAQIEPEDIAPAPDPIELPAPPGERPASAAAAREIYTPADFARFAPRNALDMIEQIPGFTVEGAGRRLTSDTGDEARGLGQASGNLLINGDRISSKSVSLAEALARIPADNVERIEVVDGATLDIPGLSGRVANIIARTGNLTGQFAWRPQFVTEYGRFAWRNGEVSLAGQTGGVEFVVALKNTNSNFATGGQALVRDAAGVLDERTNETTQVFDNPQLTGNLAFSPASDVSANVNFSGELPRTDVSENEFRAPGSAFSPFDELILQTNEGYGYELGGDVEFPIGPGRLKLIALEAFDHSDFATQSVIRQAAVPATGIRFARAQDIGERIARGEYSWSMWRGDWQLSAEAAFNRFDQEGFLFRLDPAGEEFVPAPLPGGVGGVTEDRYEALLSYSRPLTGRLSMQIVAGGEYSQIAQTGGNALSRTFQRPKGSLALAWAAADGLDINMELARRVGQLNFADFLADVNLNEDNLNAGNNRLRPQQSWEVELEVAKNLGRWGSVTLDLFAQRISDYVTIIPLPGGGESSGNVDRASAIGFGIDGTLNLAPLGVGGAQLDVEFDLQKSRLRDPLTGVRRAFAGTRFVDLYVEYRHDLPGTDWAYGAYMETFDTEPYFRLDEEGVSYGAAPRISVYAEHKDVAGMTVNLAFENITRDGLRLIRTVYDGPRDTAPILFTEDRERYFGYSIKLSVTGGF